MIKKRFKKIEIRKYFLVLVIRISLEMVLVKVGFIGKLEKKLL